MSDSRFIQRDENPDGIHLPLEPLPGHSSCGRLERILRRGEFAVTTELNPPDSADPEGISATGSHGVLRIVIPKKPESTPRRIQVGATLDS